MLELLYNINNLALKLAISLLFSWLISATASAEINTACARTIALSPSLVEVIDLLKMTPTLVGVSKFTQYPEQIKNIQKIGGFLDPNIEAILSLNPSIVFALSEHQDLTKKLLHAGIKVSVHDHRSLNGIIDSIAAIGELCGVATEARERASQYRMLISDYKQALIGKTKVRSLLLISGKEDALNFRNLYVSGSDGFYQDLLELAGAKNIYYGITQSFSSVSRESLIKDNPEVIFHIITDQNLKEIEKNAILNKWRELSFLQAAKNNKIFLLTDYEDTIPGPRFPLIINKLKNFLARR